MKEVKMKEVKYSAVGSSSTSSVEAAGNLITRFWSPKLPAHFNAGLVTVAVVSLMIVLQIRDTLKSGLFDDFKRMIRPLDPPDEVDLPQRWNYSSHEFLPILSDWDEQRVRWIEADLNLKLPEGARPRVMMVTGSSQDEGELYILSHLLLRAGKNKQDYSQMHDMELFYNMVNPDLEFSDWWVKLPTVRMLMLRHPEVEWIWWLDADAVITDMTFEPPFAMLDDYNLILYGEDRLVHDKLDPAGLSTGAFLIRNCQWSLDLLGAWAYTGTDSKRDEASDAKLQEEMEANRTTVDIIPGDDRSSLVALLTQDKRNPTGQQMWVHKVKLVEETEYTLNGNWAVVAPKLEELSQDVHHGVPFVTHFEGCLPHPSEVPVLSRQDSENFTSCVEQLQRAFDFAENQVYRELGLERNTLGNSTEPFVWKDTAKKDSTETAFRILPVVTDWDKKRKAYMESNPWIRKDLAVILSGSPPTPCTEKEGAHLLVRGLKNKIDYSRVHGIRVFYNMAVIHKNLTGWWSKLPALKLMMINSLDVEWIWWTDSDAVFTSMHFDLPFERYDGYNLVMWGQEHDVFDLKKYNSINTGNMFIRNCQWSLDLLDKWASLANTSEAFLESVLDRPPGWPTDDQSTLVYLLITERERWASKVYYQNDGTVVMSGEWHHWTDLFVDEYKMRSDKRPLMTHFAGCHPCKTELGFDICLERYDRAYNFADNQVLELYGLRHERLNSSHVVVDYLRDAQEWTNQEIEGMVVKTPGVDTTEEQEKAELPTTEQEEKVDPTKKQEEQQNVESTDKQGEVRTTKEEELTTEEEKANQAKEQEETTATREEEKQGPTSKEEAVTDTKGEESLDTKEEQVDPTKEGEVIPTKEETGEASKESELGNDTKETVETDKEEKVNRPEEETKVSKGQDEMGKQKKGESEEKEPTREEVMEATAEERGVQPDEKSTPGQEEHDKQTEERDAPQELGKPAKGESKFTQVDP